MTKRAAALCLAALCLAGPAPAHERSVSHLRLVEDAAGVGVRLRIDERELTRLPAPGTGSAAGPAADLLVAGALAIERGGVPCAAPSPPRREPSAAGRVILRWRLDCPSPGELGLSSTLAEVLGTPHLSFVRLEAHGLAPRETVLHGDRPRWDVPAGRWNEAAVPSTAAVAGEAVRLGVEHIASGADHLAFVVGLLLGASTLAGVATLVTAFTAAHTLTLGLASLGVLRPLPSAVEPMIAVSIAIVAVENIAAAAATPGPRSPGHPARLAALLLLPALAASASGFGRVPLPALAGVTLFAVTYLALASRRPGTSRLRWVVAFVFGLLHGMGFASALAESGFAEDSALATLLGFNVGVEAGQLAFVATLWPLLVLARRRLGASFARAVVEPAGVVLLALAVAWYLGRAFG